MASSSRLPSQAQSQTLPRLIEHRPEGAEAWASVEDALDIVRRTRANLLVVGPEAMVMDVVCWVIADVPASIVTPCDGGRIRLPERALPHSTLVLRDIDQLDVEGQASLFAWLEKTGGDQQVVSTASELLPSLVNEGSFDRGLYYRLNTIYIRLHS